MHLQKFVTVKSHTSFKRYLNIRLNCPATGKKNEDGDNGRNRTDDYDNAGSQRTFKNALRNFSGICLALTRNTLVLLEITSGCFLFMCLHML